MPRILHRLAKRETLEKLLSGWWFKGLPVRTHPEVGPCLRIDREIGLDREDFIKDSHALGQIIQTTVVLLKVTQPRAIERITAIQLRITALPKQGASVLKLTNAIATLIIE